MERERRLRAAIGPRAEYYLKRWAEMDAAGRAASWNWAACLLNFFWFAYRKMWGPMLAMGLALLVATPLIDPANRTLLRAVMFALVGLSFLAGGYGNWLYRRRIGRLVADPAADEARLADKGGVSLAAALGALVGITLLSLLAGMVSALL